MDEFKPEDELKPDTSDRRPTRPRKTSSLSKVSVSRQHMMMGTGILILLLLVIGIGSALKAPNSGNGQAAQQPQRPAGVRVGEKSIDLSDTTSMSGQSSQRVPTTNQNTTPQELSMPEVASTPTEAQPLALPKNQQRVELPGNLNNALSNQQGQVDAITQGNLSSLPTAPATVMAPRQSAAPHNKPAVAHKSATSKSVAKEHKPAATANHSTTLATKSPVTSGSMPGGNFTLQLSSASRSDTLNAWAKKQHLNNYHVYKTTRNGQPWYVLVSGSYATSVEAKRAASSLSADIRAQNPWVKPVSQVKKEVGK